MTTDFPALPAERLTGKESFHVDGDPIGFDVLSFWQWGVSNLAANNLRGHLAEYLVAKDLGLDTGTRREWDTCDLRTDHNIRIEVKSASYIQQWRQKRLSPISFDIAPSQGWDPATRTRTKTKQRNSDTYVFCLIETKDQATFDPTDLSQWLFLVLATRILNERLGNQKRVSLGRLRSLNPVECRFGEIARALKDAAGK